MAQFHQVDELDCFANTLYTKNIESILPTAELLINFKENGSHITQKKICLLYAEKMDFKGLIQIRLNEKCDHRKMYITTVDSQSFPELKQEQSLHVTFSGFVDNLVHLLKESLAGKLEIFIVQLIVNRDIRFSDRIDNSNSTTNHEYQMQFVELRTFKNLIHLSLPCRLAPVNVVLFYLSNILETLQNKTAAHDLAVQQIQHELLMQQRRNEQLEVENQKLRENLQENIVNLNQRHAEEVKQLQESCRKASEQRHNDNERNRKTITSLQAQIEKLSMEKDESKAEKSQENKRLESLSEQLNNCNTQLANMRSQNELLQAEIASLRNEERKTEMHLNDARRYSSELQEKLKQYDKNKADLVAELEAEKKISQTKRQALEVATEEISKANEIIYKQAQELLKLKKTVEWRTEIALQQEKAIREKEKELLIYDEELNQMRIVVKNLREEVPQQLDSLRQFADSLQMKYKEEINALRDSLNSCKENHSHYDAKPTTSRRKYNK